MNARVMVVGCAQTVLYTEVQGISHVPAAKEWNGASRLVQGLNNIGYEVTHLSATLAPTDFPEDIGSLACYKAIIIGDIASDTLLLHPEVVYDCLPHPNRLQLLRRYVLEGGGLVMTGGWLSFQGIDGKGRWHSTAVEEVLPVRIMAHDDRVECPQGIRPAVQVPGHPVLRGLPDIWPRFLGYNRFNQKEDAEVIMTIGGDPFLVLGDYGRGRSVAFASSMGPHWGGMREYLEWEGHDRFWGNVLGWVTASE